MVMRRHGALLLAAVSALGAACSDPPCEPITACDIRANGCQRDVLRLAACLRDSPADSQVRVEIVDYDTYLDEQKRDAQDEEPTQDDLDMRDGLAAFELRPPYDPEEDARRESEWVGAFYDPAADMIVVLDRGGASDADEQRSRTVLLVHEMIHALQGADGTIDTLWTGLRSHDQMLAASSMVEGEASLLEDRAVVEALGFEFAEVPFDRALRAFRKWSLERLRDSEDLFPAVRSGVPYAYGSSYLYEGYKSGGIEALRERIEAPPRTGRELLGERAATKKVRAPVPVIEGATVVGVYHLGPFFVEAFLQNLHQDAPRVLEHVVDDVFSVQRLDNGEMAAAWRIRFDESALGNELIDFIDEQTNRYVLGNEAGDELFIARGQAFEDFDSLTFEDAPDLDFGFEEEEEGTAARLLCPHDPRQRSAFVRR